MRHLQDPPDYPTADYIDAHPQAYQVRPRALRSDPPDRTPADPQPRRCFSRSQNPNATIWSDAGFSWPRNRLYDGC
jgi:hypothetical protein